MWMLIAVVAFAMVSEPLVASASQIAVTAYQESRPDYVAQYGHWDQLDIPKQFRVNSIHAALLPTGKVLMIAGSGNNAQNFNARSFSSLLWDPATNKFKKIATPADMFCGGHAFLPNGDLLVAGGTRKYEALATQVTNAAGVVTINNTNPNDVPFEIPTGTLLTGPNGKTYRMTEPGVVQPAMNHVMDGRMMAMPSRVQVWVEAVDKGPASVLPDRATYTIPGLSRATVSLSSEKVTLDKQDFQGINGAYEFDPFTEQYVTVGKMNYARWYPTLLGVQGGDVLAVSGLDQFGTLLPGNNEVFDPTTAKWTDRPDLFRMFPTYPALFRIEGGTGNKLFYTGMNAGYGPGTGDRTPGVWDLATNTFSPVTGLRDAQMNETGASVLLPPAQDQRIMVLGGGGVGDTKAGTARTDVIDMKASVPHFVPGPDLKIQTRYLNTSILPNDTVFATGGSTDYRGRSQSDILASYLYDPVTNALKEAAPPKIGRDYHSESILLPDGRVMVMGSNPLYADKANLMPATFEQRVEIYTPPSQYKGVARPTVSAPKEIVRGTTFAATVSNPADIVSARLIRPTASTHVTNVEQRSIRLDMTPCAANDATCAKGGNVKFSLDKNEALTPAGYYMVFVTNKAGVSSQAGWTHVA
jgi:Domain of unknown function (DUF1929)